MSEALVPTISDETKMKLMFALAAPGVEESKGLVEIAAEMDITTSDIVLLLSDPDFMKGVRQIARAQINFALYGGGIKELVNIARTGEERNRLSAIRTLAQITGELKNNHQVDVRVTFDDLRQRGSNDDPLANLFDIRSSEVIEAEVEE